MNPNTSAAAVPTQEYEDFVPSSELIQKTDADTLRVTLPGFTKEEMTVLVGRKAILKINGQRSVGKKKYQRFQMEFPVSENCDQRKISAKLENGILYVEQPKLITSAGKKVKDLPAEDAPLPKKPAIEPQDQKKTEEQATSKNTTSGDESAKQDNPENTLAKGPEKEEPENTSPKTSEQIEAESHPEKSPPEKCSTSTLEDGEKTSSCSKPDESKNDMQLQEDNGIKEVQFGKEKAAGDASLPKEPANEPQDQKKAEEQAISEKTTLREPITKQDNAENTPAIEPAKEESKATSPKTSEPTETKSPPEASPSQKHSTSTSKDAKTSSSNKPDESLNDATTGTVSDLFAKLKTPRKVINTTLAALLILGIGGYVINARKSSKKAKK